MPLAPPPSRSLRLSALSALLRQDDIRAGGVNDRGSKHDVIVVYAGAASSEQHGRSRVLPSVFPEESNGRITWPERHLEQWRVTQPV